MNTAELTERIATQHGLTNKQARQIIDSVFAAITETAKRGEEIALTGFGRFKVIDRAERQGRNPASGEPITIVASKKLSFAPAKPVHEALNSAAAEDTAEAA